MRLSKVVFSTLAALALAVPAPAADANPSPHTASFSGSYSSDPRVLSQSTSCYYVTPYTGLVPTCRVEFASPDLRHACTDTGYATTAEWYASTSAAMQPFPMHWVGPGVMEGRYYQATPPGVYTMQIRFPELCADAVVGTVLHLGGIGGRPAPRTTRFVGDVDGANLA